MFRNVLVLGLLAVLWPLAMAIDGEDKFSGLPDGVLRQIADAVVEDSPEDVKALKDTSLTFHNRLTAFGFGKFMLIGSPKKFIRSEKLCKVLLNDASLRKQVRVAYVSASVGSRCQFLDPEKYPHLQKLYYQVMVKGPSTPTSEEQAKLVSAYAVKDSPFRKLLVSDPNEQFNFDFYNLVFRTFALVINQVGAHPTLRQFDVFDQELNGVYSHIIMSDRMEYKAWKLEQLTKMKKLTLDPLVPKHHTSPLILCTHGTFKVYWNSDETFEKNCISALAEAGADVNYHTSQGLTMMHYAAGLKERKIIKVLLEHGGNKDEVASYPLVSEKKVLARHPSPVMFTLPSVTLPFQIGILKSVFSPISEKQYQFSKYNGDRIRESNLHRGDLPLFELMDRGASFLKQSESDAPFWKFGLLKENAAILYKVLDAKDATKMVQETFEGNTLLHHFTSLPKETFEKVLTMNLNWNIQNHKGETPLMLAFKNLPEEQDAMILLLNEPSLNVHVADHLGQTASHYLKPTKKTNLNILRQYLSKKPNLLLRRPLNPSVKVPLLIFVEFAVKHVSDENERIALLKDILNTIDMTTENEFNLQEYQQVQKMILEQKDESLGQMLHSKLPEDIVGTLKMPKRNGRFSMLRNVFALPSKLLRRPKPMTPLE